VLSRLDRLLEEFESEYHFLFGRVYAEANRAAPAVQLEEYYPLPNLARRLLESFLAFRYPAVPGELSNKMKLVVFNEQKKLRILRFLHTYSHGDQIAEATHDLTLLGEAPQIMAEMLELMKDEDGKHYAAMVSGEPIAEPRACWRASGGCCGGRCRKNDETEVSYSGHV